MRFLQKLLIIITLIYCNQCIKYLDIENQTLYNEIVDHFFPKELRHPGIDMGHNLCEYLFIVLKCSSCTKLYIYIMVPVALMLFSITISHLLKSTLIFFSVWPKSKNCSHCRYLTQIQSSKTYSGCVLW